MAAWEAVRFNATAGGGEGEGRWALMAMGWK